MKVIFWSGSTVSVVVDKVLNGDGSVGAPSYSFASASDRGMYTDGTNLCFADAGIQSFLANQYGIGINVAPDASTRLGIRKDQAATTQIFLRNDNASGAVALKFSAVDDVLFGANGSGAGSAFLNIGAGYTNGFSISQGGNAAISLKTNGSIGLQVAGTQQVAFGGPVTEANVAYHLQALAPTSLAGTFQIGAQLDMSSTSAATNGMSGYFVQMATQNASYTVPRAMAFHVPVPMIPGSSHITNFVSFSGTSDDAATNNALLADNTSFVGNYFLHQAGTDASSLGGQLRVASLGVGNSAAASTPGTVVKKIQVFNASGSSLGYVAVFDAIT